MNTKIKAAVTALMAALISGCVSMSSTSSPGLTATEKMMWSTYALATPRGMATCVIVNRRDPSAPNGIQPVLVTSAHVLMSAPHGPFYVIVREQQPGSNPAIGVIEFSSDSGTGPAFFTLPGRDIAVMSLDIPPEFADQVPLRSFIDETTIGLPGNQCRVGDEMSILGFPHILPGTEGAFPILRSGKMASYSMRPPEEGKTFLINTTVFGGDSGAPVFATDRYQRRVRLAGMISQRIGEKENGVPLAVAVNASVIRETLDLQALGGRVDIGPVENVTAVKPQRSRAARMAGPPVPWPESVLASRYPKSPETKTSSFVPSKRP